MLRLKLINVGNFERKEENKRCMKNLSLSDFELGGVCWGEQIWDEEDVGMINFICLEVFILLIIVIFYFSRDFVGKGQQYLFFWKFFRY